MGELWGNSLVYFVANNDEAHFNKTQKYPNQSPAEMTPATKEGIDTYSAVPL